MSLLSEFLGAQYALLLLFLFEAFLRFLFRFVLLLIGATGSLILGSTRRGSRGGFHFLSLFAIFEKSEWVQEDVQIGRRLDGLTWWWLRGWGTLGLFHFVGNIVTNFSQVLQSLLAWLQICLDYSMNFSSMAQSFRDWHQIFQRDAGDPTGELQLRKTQTEDVGCSAATADTSWQVAADLGWPENSAKIIGQPHSQLRSTGISLTFSMELQSRLLRFKTKLS